MFSIYKQNVYPGGSLHPALVSLRYSIIGSYTRGDKEKPQLICLDLTSGNISAKYQILGERSISNSHDHPGTDLLGILSGVPRKKSEVPRIALESAIISEFSKITFLDLYAYVNALVF